MQSYLMIKPRRVALVLLLIALLLAGISLVVDYVSEVQYAGSIESWIDFIDLFSVNLESSIPTWYSTILLVSASVLFGIIALGYWQQQGAYRRHWVGLTLVFLYLSMDEGAAIHELAADPLQTLFDTVGYLYFGWQIVAVPLVILFVLVYVPFLFNLPNRTRYGMIIAGMIYVGGAVVVEGFSADLLFNADGVYTYPYLVTATIEESMEMLGVITLIYVLLDHMVRYRIQFALLSHPSQAEDWVIETDPSFTPKPEGDWLQRQFLQLQNTVYAPYLVAITSGFTLALVGWIAIRELQVMTPLPHPLVGLIAVYLIGFGLRWFAIGKLKPTLKPVIAVLPGMIFLSLPIWIRLLSSTPIITTGLILLTLGVFISLSPDETDHTNTRLMRLAITLIGTVIGWLSLSLISQLGLFIAMVLIGVGVLLVLWLLKLSGRVWFALMCLMSAWLWFFPFINQWSNIHWYQGQFESLSLTATLYSDYSLTHKIDVLDDKDNNRYLFVDRTPIFDPITDRSANSVKGRIPASLLTSDNALVIGASSMQMELLIANYAGHVTTIEPHQKLIDISQRFFTTYNFMDRLDNRTIETGDVIPYLQSTTTPFDLIVVDQLVDGVDMVELMTVVEEQLTEEGLFVMELEQVFNFDSLDSTQFVEALLQTFDGLLIINLDGRGYAYAGDISQISRVDLQLALNTLGDMSFTIFETETIRALIEANS